MEDRQREYIYAFLSLVFTDIMEEQFIEELKENTEFLEMISVEALEWFQKTSQEELTQLLNRDFSSLFLMNSIPVESFVMDDKDEVQVGLQNPVMQFYFSHGYELNLLPSKINAPDHIALECAFMQNLVQRNEKKVQIRFLEEHLLKWAPIYFLGIKDMAKTPFYRDLCDFSAEFLIADYDYLKSEDV
ncbi:TorD/DmsD family molecular chaperone [Sulfurospirillum arcachonense]|uniref:TorD/DmsD family molecular chaperone n=1 Tax=Sulfurospirillum arcachonense TaxID=57666 RepID=UPI00046A9DA3|nr:molecular chaperone TorD family protein [Sulfurospirillum arcachonense]